MTTTTTLTDRVPWPSSGQSRAPGLHVSGVLRDYCLAHGILRPGGMSDRDGQALMAMGQIWETGLTQALERLHPGRYVDPGQLERDGVYGHPDLLDIQDVSVVEIKLTWAKICGPDDPKLWRYWAQVLCYCHMLGARRADLAVAFVRGNYGSTPAAFRWWRREVTRHEVINNWRRLMNHAQDRAGDGVELKEP